MNSRLGLSHIGALLAVAVFLVGILAAGYDTVRQVRLSLAGTSATSTVVVGNAPPTVTNVILNNNGAITLLANTVQTVNVNATISDNNGCSDINHANATMTITIYRSGITSSTCDTTQNDLNCYRATAFTASSTCASGTTNTTTTFSVQYFADATDASSSYNAQNWLATVIFKDPSNDKGEGVSSGQEMNSLTALNVTTSTTNYGTLTASSTSGTTDNSTPQRVATSTNAGNSSTTILLSANSTLAGGGNSIATSNQRYSTSTFTYVGTSTALTGSPVEVPGFFLWPPTSSVNVAQRTYWGLQVDAGTPTGTYSGQNLFTAMYRATST